MEMVIEDNGERACKHVGRLIVVTKGESPEVTCTMEVGHIGHNHAQRAEIPVINSDGKADEHAKRYKTLVRWGPDGVAQRYHPGLGR